MMNSALALRPEARELRVALVCMPFCMAESPSLQIGLLAAIAKQAGFDTTTLHLNVDLAARIPDSYQGLCSHRGRMTGEWLFSLAAFPDHVVSDEEEYCRLFPEEVAWARKGGKDASFFSVLRHDVLPRFIADCAANYEWGSYDVVGFTSTFQQNVASLALAQRIKQAHPHVRIIFGGANMEGEMGLEYARAFPCIDNVVIGEGDVAFPELLRRLAANEDLSNLRGVTRRVEGEIVFGGPSAPFTELDRLPTPDYHEFFDRCRQHRLPRRTDLVSALPFESSRGCWWGVKHHCTFCGLNGATMAFRSKAPQRVLQELSELAALHSETMFQATDNIVDMKYLESLFARISSTKTDYQFFYETKANLSPDQIRAMRAGGVRWLQPGIESLSTHVLQLMRKGCTMLQNVRTLKWCLYHRIRVGWNLLWGFPGEVGEDYAREFEVLQLIPHLEPPNGAGRIWMERFAPLFTDRRSFPARRVCPDRSYEFAYPKFVALDKAAYFFEYELDNTLPDDIHQPTVDLVLNWKARWLEQPPPALSYRRTLDAILINDSRTQQAGTQVFSGPLAALYEICVPTMHSVQQAQRLLAGAGHCYSAEEIQWALDEFCRRGFMLNEGAQYLALAIPENPNW